MAVEQLFSIVSQASPAGDQWFFMVGPLSGIDYELVCIQVLFVLGTVLQVYSVFLFVIAFL